ncbi:hypothetical protein Dimus_011834 [Dionaea muscipula]
MFKMELQLKSNQAASDRAVSTGQGCLRDQVVLPPIKAASGRGMSGKASGKGSFGRVIGGQGLCSTLGKLRRREDWRERKVKGRGMFIGNRSWEITIATRFSEDPLELVGAPIDERLVTG